ncbi:aldehyde dehydrogenase (NADP(+)) [Fulvivirga sediminis]|uniref:Aldehyde dehydrogenase (NADP(+)) n=1 Tax=Fulvivirga sediminis TaxID=2803949 RepID=A0A937F7U1_9BACT|nr:aldehyde dehydrogenase (NADP(+)) [Fulvivirga sediminis]MBL3655905.1 aldehyde dehydrogenase (NADP(+)) [Fulvivirga sediminis]
MHGKNRIGYSLLETEHGTVKAYSPITKESLPEKFDVAGQDEVNTALDQAEKAFSAYKYISATKKADFLDAIADEILALGDELIERACLESALPEGRIRGERGRTMGQLKMFASLLRDGSWVEASIEPAMPDREPLPRADLRKMLRPVGPVVVFTASNFPLAFSTAGGDTASALAAGNPVIVKAHESHLGTNELVSDAIARAAEKTEMPDGVFCSLTGKGYEIGKHLVQHPKTKSVAFTGSFKGGKALYDLANERENPIPVFAEMGSINPVFVLPDKVATDPESLAKATAGSINLGVGQFCTNPGLIIGIKSDALNTYISTLATETESIQATTMLNSGIAKAYKSGADHAAEQSGVQVIAKGAEAEEGLEGQSTVATVSATDFLKTPELQHEVFGPFSLIVTCADSDEVEKIIASLSGQLTATFLATDKDIADFETIIKNASELCGRLIFNSFPTGVEVCHSMQHGGPYPAATDSRFTSVGTGAIKRFVRPVCYQDAPKSILPEELHNDNPLNIWRLVNGSLNKDKI